MNQSSLTKFLPHKLLNTDTIYLIAKQNAFQLSTEMLNFWKIARKYFHHYSIVIKPERKEFKMTVYPEVPEVNKPGKVQAIAIMTLVDGILNVLWSFVVGIGVLSGAIATFGIGLLCTPIAILPLVVGIFEIIAGAKLLKSPARKFKVKTIAILEIVNIISFAFTSLVVGILNLVFYNDPEVKAYIDSLPS